MPIPPRSRNNCQHNNMRFGTIPKLLPVKPIHRTPDGRFELKCTDQARRLAARRCEAETDVFRERYAKRSGIESTNNGLKNRLGLGRLRVRGRGAVFRTLLLKVSGWNVLRASASEKLRAMVQEELTKLLGAAWAWPFGQDHVVARSLSSRFMRSRAFSNAFRSATPRIAALFQRPATLAA